tara:strand:+ start:1031 stop:1258 length:228 start_codon:yes stop_codon:yes gene_type:complete
LFQLLGGENLFGSKLLCLRLYSSWSSVKDGFLGIGIATAFVAEELVRNGADISIMYSIKKIIEIDKLKGYIQSLG